MRRGCLLFVVLALSLLAARPVYSQRPPGGSMRIVLLVDSSQAMSPMITQFRAALKGFLDDLAGDPEIVLVTTGGHFRVRVGPTTDRQKVQDVVSGFASDGGGNVMLETMLEADERFLKIAPDKRPIFVIMTTDLLTTVGEPRVEMYNRFAGDFLTRGGLAHAVVVRGVNPGFTSQIAENLTRNTGGFFQAVAIANALPRLMRDLAERIALDQ